MTALDLIRFALQASHQRSLALLKELADKPMLQPTPNGGNHALWTVGHLAVVEAGIQQIVFGRPNPIENWRPLFAPRTQPQTDPAVYPSFDVVLAKFSELRGLTLELIETLSHDDLDQPPLRIPSGFEELMKTKGRALSLLSMHLFLHCGELAVVRKAASIPSYM